MGRHNSRLKKIKRRMDCYDKSKRNRIAIMPSFSVEDAIIIANELGIDFETEKFTLEEFLAGINVELEHGSKYSETNISKNDPIITGKIAYAHLKEFPDYYERLKKLEEEATAYWNTKGTMN